MLGNKEMALFYHSVVEVPRRNMLLSFFHRRAFLWLSSLGPSWPYYGRAEPALLTAATISSGPLLVSGMERVPEINSARSCSCCYYPVQLRGIIP